MRPRNWGVASGGAPAHRDCWLRSPPIPCKQRALHGGRGRQVLNQLFATMVAEGGCSGGAAGSHREDSESSFSPEFLLGGILRQNCASLGQRRGRHLHYGRASGVGRGRLSTRWIECVWVVLCDLGLGAQRHGICRPDHPHRQQLKYVDILTKADASGFLFVYELKLVFPGS